MLQRYLFMEAKPLTEAVVWILDDDVVLEGLAYDSSGSQQIAYRRLRIRNQEVEG